MLKNTENPKFDIFELGTVSEVVAKFGGVKLLDEVKYVVPPVPMFGAACPNPDTNRSHWLVHPAVYYAKVSDYKMIGDAAFPIIQNKSITHQYFSTEYWETTEQALKCCDIRQEQNLIGYCNIKARHHYTCKVINLIGNGAYNYAHWITEYLPQLVLLKNAGLDLSEYKVLVDSRSFPSMLEAVYLLGITDEQLIKIEAMTLNDFPEALWVSPVANVVFQRPHAMASSELDQLTDPQHATFHPEALKATRSIFLNLVLQSGHEQPETAPERVFIKRFSGRKFHARSIINEAEIQVQLESEGFVSIDPSTLSFSEQIRFFSKAKYIVAASGAALLNMMWAPGGAQVIVLMNDSRVANYWYFSNIAYSVGHKLSYVLGRIVDTGNWSDVHHADFEIDIEAVISALESVGFPFAEKSDVDVHVNKILKVAKLYQQEERLQEAVNVYQEILALVPEHAEANYNLGLIELQLYGAMNALERFQCAVFKQPEKEQYWVSYIETLMQAGAVDSVADALELGMKYSLRASSAQRLAASFLLGERIGFLIHTLELVNHYACIWNLLPDNSFDVLLYGEAVGTEHRVFTDYWKCNIVNVDEVVRSKAKYKYLVSNHAVELDKIPLIKQLGSVNIRFMYAAGKSGWNLSEWNKLYDVIFCFGPYHAAKFSDSTDAVVLQMGYPRFDRYFTQQPDRNDLYAKYDCDPLKKTVVWLPTWKTLSSVTHFDAEISALTERYNVVIKLHPLMPESEPERVAALKQHHFTHVITDSSDNLPLYQIADFMLFDYGGPPLAAIYADKNLVLLNVQGAANDDLTGEDSPDITIRRHLVNVNPADKAIAELLADASLWEQQRPVRRALRKTYFAPYFGFSSQVAANALLNLKHLVGKGGPH